MSSKYKVECFHKSISGYDTSATYSPDYVMTVMSFPKYLWFPWWPRVQYGVIVNYESAEKEAALRAIHHARVLNKKTPTKVLHVTELNGKKLSTPIWENRKLLRLGLLPWYKRWPTMFWRWYKKKAETPIAKDKESSPRSRVVHPK